MSAKLFVFVQVEVPFPLGPPDGRYVIRNKPGSEPEHVLVLRSDPDGNALATLIDAVSISAEQQARAWLEDLDNERELEAALSRLNAALRAYRIAAGDPTVHAIAQRHATMAAVGWGTGEQVAEGRFTEIMEIRLAAPQTAPPQPNPLLPAKRIAAAERHHERFAALLGARDSALLCEELALRARADLEIGHLEHAATELERAYSAALWELGTEWPSEPEGQQSARRRTTSRAVAERIPELRDLYPGVLRQAQAALSEDPPADALGGGEADDPLHGRDVSEAATIDAEVLARALGRLEAVLRLRAAGL